MSIIIELALFFIFTFDFGFDFLRVAIKVAPVSSDPSPLIWQVFPFEPNSNLSDVKLSVVPSDRIKEYLLGMKGKKSSFSSDVGRVLLVN